LAATNHTVIVFDNRGIGENTVGTKPFSIEQFANDTAGLLDALQMEKADVLWASLGSFVAQELTLNYPQQVDRLVLHAGYCGGNETVYASGQALELVIKEDKQEILNDIVENLLREGYPLLANAFRDEKTRDDAMRILQMMIEEMES
jgi:pimeloyl-ACP methyl ester carboxylesterase